MCAKGVKFGQSANKILYFGLVFPRSNPNSQPISACDISKERKQISAQIYHLIFLSRSYLNTLGVIIKLIYCIVTFLHTVYCKHTLFCMVFNFVKINPSRNQIFVKTWDIGDSHKSPIKIKYFYSIYSLQRLII